MSWIKRESSNYIFNYRKGSISESDIEHIISTQESCYKFICKALDVTMEGKINYYLCSTPEEVGEIYGDNEPCNAFACRPDKVYAVYNEKVKCIGFHEDTHIISYNTLARPKPAFMREGLAMYFDRTYWGIDNYLWSKHFLKNDKYIRICSLINNEEFFKHSDRITYPIAGAFVDYIITFYGMDKFKKLYMNEEIEFMKWVKEIYGVSLEEIEKEFIEYLDLIKFDEHYIEQLIKQDCK